LIESFALAKSEEIPNQLLEEIEAYIAKENSSRNMICRHFFRAVQVDQPPVSKNKMLTKFWKQFGEEQHVAEVIAGVPEWLIMIYSDQIGKLVSQLDEKSSLASDLQL
jgi:hypothetical protein